MASKRGNPVARVGNYAQDVDTTGMDESMKDLMFGVPRGKTGDAATDTAEKQFTGSDEAVRRARRANKQPRLKSNQ